MTTATMLGWVEAPAGPMVVSRIPVPRPRPGEALIRVRAVALDRVARPIVHAGVAGEVLITTHPAGRFSPGDRVLVSAPHRLRPEGAAEYTTCPVDQLHRLPGELSFITGACVGSAFPRAWDALIRRSRVASGERVVVLECASPVATAALQVVRWKGARVVAVADGRHARRLTALGAHRVISHSAPDIGARIRTAFDGSSATLVVTPGAGGELSSLQAPFARTVSTVGDAALEPGPDVLGHILKLVGEGTFVAVIDSILALTDARTAQARANDAARLGAVVVVPETDSDQVG